MDGPDHPISPHWATRILPQTDGGYSPTPWPRFTCWECVEDGNGGISDGSTGDDSVGSPRPLVGDGGQIIREQIGRGGVGDDVDPSQENPLLLQGISTLHLHSLCLPLILSEHHLPSSDESQSS